MKGYVYLLTIPDTDKIYIGSTTQRLCQRKAEHRYDFKNKRFNKSCDELFNISQDVSMYVLEELDVKDRKDLYFLEQIYIDVFNDVVVNKKNAI